MAARALAGSRIYRAFVQYCDWKPPYVRSITVAKKAGPSKSSSSKSSKSSTSKSGSKKAPPKVPGFMKGKKKGK